MIRLCNVTKRYGETVALSGVTLSLPTEKVVALIGSNGAGKSTALNIIGRLIPASAGTVEIDGKSLRDWKSNELAKRLAILGQTLYTPARLTVEELVAFGRFPHSRGNLGAADLRIIDDALEYTGISTLRGCFIDELSGGQRQIAYIAMAIAQDTKYILLDEPLNNLDMNKAAKIMKLLRTLVREKKRSVLLVIHDINFVSFYADYVVAFKNGALKYSGKTEDVIRSEVLRDVYDMEIAIKSYRDKRLCVYYE